MLMFTKLLVLILINLASLGLISAEVVTKTTLNTINLVKALYSTDTLLFDDLNLQSRLNPLITFTDPLAFASGRHEVLCQFDSLKIFFKKSINISYEVEKSTPRELKLNWVQEYTWWFGHKTKIESTVLVGLDDKNRINSIEDRWNHEVSWGGLSKYDKIKDKLRIWNGKYLPYYLDVLFKIKYFIDK